jgi:hypothetical protein
MDVVPTLSQYECLLLDINRAPNGRLEGQLRSQTTDTWMPFSGVLELLKAIEETLDAIDSADYARDQGGTES